MKILQIKFQIRYIRVNSGLRLWCLLVRGPTVKSLGLPLVATLNITVLRGELHTHSLIKQVKAWATNTQQDLPDKGGHK
jgi:hypothetical protein